DAALAGKIPLRQTLAVGGVEGEDHIPLGAAEAEALQAAVDPSAPDAGDLVEQPAEGWVGWFGAVQGMSPTTDRVLTISTLLNPVEALVPIPGMPFPAGSLADNAALFGPAGGFVGRNRRSRHPPKVPCRGGFAADDAALFGPAGDFVGRKRRSRHPPRVPCRGGVVADDAALFRPPGGFVGRHRRRRPPPRVPCRGGFAAADAALFGPTGDFIGPNRRSRSRGRPGCR